MKVKKINFKDYKIVTRGKIRWIAPKKHSGIYLCDWQIIDSEGKSTIFKQIGGDNKTLILKMIK